MIAEFSMNSKDYGIVIEATCTSDTGCYPNQRDLRDSLNKLLFDLMNWEHVDITIKTVKDGYE